MPEESVVILFVGNEASGLRDRARAMAREFGAEVREAASGPEALAACRETVPDLVLVDAGGPAGGGFRVAGDIRRLLGKGTPPVLFVADPGEDVRNELREFGQGMVDVLFRPLDPWLLGMRVRAFIEMERGRRTLARALEEQRRQSVGLASLLRGAQDILAHVEFATAARSIYDRCRDLTGATAGYVALLSRDGHENELLFLDSGGGECSVDPALPMPVRGLRAEVYASGTTVVENGFARSRWMRLLPEGHVPLDNVLFAPLTIDGRVEGVMGLANKPGGFTGHDERMATAFAELAAVALRNSRTLESLNRTMRLMRRGQRIAFMGSFELDAAGLHCSDELPGILGHPDGAVPDADSFFAHVHPDDRTPLDLALAGARSGGPAVDMEFRVVRGGKMGVVHIQAESLRDADGAPAIIGACQDVTARRELEQRAVITQKLDALGQLAGGVAHEMNTPLQYAIGNLGFIGTAFRSFSAAHEAWERMVRRLREAGLADEAGEMVEDMRRLRVGDHLAGVPEAVSDAVAGLEKISDVVRSLVRFARTAPEGDACCDLNRMIEDAVALTRALLEEVAEIRMNLSPDMPPVICMPGDMSHCLLNLLLNAVHAVRAKYDGGGKGNIVIGTELRNKCAVITVADDGVGIPEELQDRIFEPFFTTKEVGEGTGMGLSVARSAIKSLGGRLDFVSFPGRGTTFRISLPANCAPGAGG